jgi:PKD repeat protein
MVLKSRQYLINEQICKYPHDVPAMKPAARIISSLFIALLLLCPIATANPEILGAHNAYRTEVGAVPLTYSGTLAASAGTWAGHIAGTGVPEHSSLGYGENIAAAWPAGSRSWTDVVDLWGAEKKNFIYGPFGDSSSSIGHWYDVGHYTQIIWDTTTEVGCGRATNVSQNAEFFVCQYNPPGNYWGRYPYACGAGVVPLSGNNNPPTDPDGDCIYEDLNGNGRLDFADVVLYFNRMEWIAENEPVSAFDLNGNGRIDFADIVKLFGEI